MQVCKLHDPAPVQVFFLPMEASYRLVLFNFAIIDVSCVKQAASYKMTLQSNLKKMNYIYETSMEQEK